MAGKVLNDGIDVLAERYLGTSSEGPIVKIRVGIGTTAATISDTELEIAIPISDGTTNDDGSNQLTGSSGGDNSTDNTTTFKEGAGQSDVTAQNLIANNTNATKIWTISNLASAGTNIDASKPFGLWFYINDAADLAKFKSSGTALEIKLGSDSSNYFSLTKTASDLAVGWNWITSNKVDVVNLTETGTAGSPVDTFIIEVTTNNATDQFITGDVIYDLLRQWADSDLEKVFDSGYPAYNSSTKEINSVTTLLLIEANGFPISEILTQNSSETGWSRDTITTFSKSSTEEMKVNQKDKLNNS